VEAQSLIEVSACARIASIRSASEGGGPSRPGLFAAWVPDASNPVLAIQLRAQEHKEEGVLRLGSIVGEIEPRMQMWLWQLKNTPQQVNPGQTEPSLWGIRACPGVRLQVGIGCIGSRRIGKTTARHAPRYERFAWALHSPILPTCPHDGEAL
jgi:hypothetical protein